MRFIFFLFIYFAGLQVTGQNIAVNNLTCEYLRNPLGIDEKVPRLSWKIKSRNRDFRQSAYQIRVFDGDENLKKTALWDSEKTDSDNSVHINYGGPELRSGHKYYWQVKVWDQNGKASKWSPMAFWEMGLLSPEDWKAQWIEPAAQGDSTQSSPCPMLRHDFNLAKKVKTATACITARGLYEANINGEKIGDQLFTPGWTSYNKRLQYQCYDVTALLRNGQNAIGVMLGDGWHSGYLGWRDRRNVYGSRLALLFQLDITYEDGTAETVISDDSWKSATGPVLMSDIYNGEVYDARLEKPGWASPGYNDAGWVSVVEAAHGKNTLVASAGPPVRAIETVRPIQILTTPKGETVFDMGQNMVGYIRLKVKGPAGSAITLKHAEVLDKDGNFYTDNLRAANQEVKYILKGDGTEVYEPYFTFQGFRYVAVEGLKDPPNPDMLTGIVIHSDMETTGAFKSSDSLINQLQHNIRWGQKGNFLDVPTDCPQRDERLGWTGDAQVFVHTAAFNMNVASFFTKWLKDLAADQHDNGVVPWVIPDVLGRGGSAGWADAATIVPWAAYLVYGDLRVLENQYESMKRWVAYMTEKAGESYLWNNGTHFGDWLFYSPDDDTSGKAAITDKHLIAQIFFANSIDITQKTAVLLGKEQEAAKYASLLKKVKEAFLNEYVTANGRLVSSTQTAYVLALQFDMLPQDQREAAAAKLVKNIQEYNYHLTTGFLGTPNLCHVLSRFGYHDVAYRLLTQETYPSWLYPVKMGATTIWERWDGIKPDGSFQNVGMNSFNHYAYGAIGDWMYRVMAGIDFDPDQPGYKHFFIRPQPGNRFSSVRASYESLYGNILSDWTLEDEKFILKVEVPANSQATVKLPFAVLEQVKESGKPLRSAKGITDSRQTDSTVTLLAGSGQYVFEYPVVGRTE